MTESRSVRIGKLFVSMEKLCHALHLPEGTVIRDAYLDHASGANTVTFIVEHPDFVDLREGDQLPVVRVLLTCHQEPGMTQRIESAWAA